MHKVMRCAMWLVVIAGGAWLWTLSRFAGGYLVVSGLSLLGLEAVMFAEQGKES